MIKGTAVTLAPPERELARAMAARRAEWRARQQVPGWAIGDGSRAGAWQDQDLLASCSELAFCKLANIYPAGIQEGAGVALEIDCRLFNGDGVDIKSTRYPTGSLRVSVRKYRPAVERTWYVLMTGTGPESEWVFRGAMRPADLIAPERLTSFGGVDHQYIADQSILIDLP
ncbi:hypothetical protein [Sphingorhabdus sp.]|uniref:hypothetical protein n=1 Tax=Sphingorhabdus sp. TaxID=1902408 RepID=UPI002FDAE5F5